MSQAQPGDALNISARDWNDMRKLIPRAKGGSNSGGTSQWVPEIYYAKTPTGGIAARVGIELSSATCEIFTRNADDELVPTGRSEPVWNLGSADVGGDEYVVVASESTRRDFVVISKDMSSSEFITDLRLSGSNLQYQKGGVWTTWETITDCPEGS